MYMQINTTTQPGNHAVFHSLFTLLTPIIQNSIVCFWLQYMFPLCSLQFALQCQIAHIYDVLAMGVCLIVCGYKARLPINARSVRGNGTDTSDCAGCKWVELMHSLITFLHFECVKCVHTYLCLFRSLVPGFNHTRESRQWPTQYCKV